MANEDINSLLMTVSYHKQLLDKSRLTEFDYDLRFKLLIKCLEEKGIFAPGELDRRWPLYLKNEIGAVGPDGLMEGNLRVTFFNPD